MTDSTMPSPLVTVRVATEEDTEQIERCRWEVYSQEGFIRPEDYPEQRESDRFDAYSQSVVATVGPDDRVIGTSRLIFGSGGPLPIQDPEHHALDIARYGSVAEVSRLCVRPEYQDGRASLGLYCVLFHLLKRHNIETALAVVDEDFFGTLTLIGFPFRKVGPPRDHMGMTIPCVCVADEILPALQSNEQSKAFGVTKLFEAPFTGQILI
jgi:N-acyl-L-homoserine lactone synthetase